MPDAPKLDTRHAHSARVYNYWLGGRDNFAADRDAAEQAIAANPGIVADVRANREFLVRAVRFLASEDERPPGDHARPGRDHPLL